MKFSAQHRILAVLSLSVISSISSAAIRTPVAGDLVISEVLANPAAVSDTYGEWFEVLNLSQDSLIIDGLLISDSGTNEHYVDTGNSLLIDPAQYFVFARNSDTTINGGLTPDYTYTNFTLSNTSDAIVLSFNSNEITRLDYDASFGISGQSMELFNLPAEISNYQLTPDTMTFGDGDIGTPGMAGSTDLAVSEVPLPAAFWLFGSGLIGMLGLSRRS
ncbi:MAG: lamin tail domain-containing protein [Gammaproteobacteria bacterium]|nr:lamin tail domain-containing protein [Gammaproteobacteria bacterium]